VYSRKNLDLAWEKVKQNHGSAGIDAVTIAEFAASKEFYLELLHRKLREGTYRPKPVKRVEIAKSDGGVRKLGIPAVFDRVCQQALVQRMAPIFEPQFFDCSFGYRKGRSPHDAMRKVAGTEHGRVLDRRCRFTCVLRHHFPGKAGRLDR
jgi:retron-type reverse transcriptase